MPADAAARLAAEQEVENLSGLSPNPEKDIFVVRENRTTCLMAEFAAKFIVPYDVWASNYVDVSGGRGLIGGSGRTGDGRGHTHTHSHIPTRSYPPVLSESPLSPPRIFSRGGGRAVGAQGAPGVAPLSPAPRLQLITEQADIPLSRGAEMKGKCGTNESELELSWLDQAYTLKLSFLKVRAPRTPGAGAGARRLRGVLTGPVSAGGAQHFPGAGGVLEAQPDPVHLRHLRAHLLQGCRQP